MFCLFALACCSCSLTTALSSSDASSEETDTPSLFLVPHTSNYILLVGLGASPSLLQLLPLGLQLAVTVPTMGGLCKIFLKHCPSHRQPLFSRLCPMCFHLLLYEELCYDRYISFCFGGCVFPEANGNASKRCFIILEAAVANLVLLFATQPSVASAWLQCQRNLASIDFP